MFSEFPGCIRNFTAYVLENKMYVRLSLVFALTSFLEFKLAECTQGK